jgi:hypothetical protein
MGYGEYGAGDNKAYYNAARFPQQQQQQQQWPRLPQQADHGIIIIFLLNYYLQ